MLMKFYFNSPRGNVPAGEVELGEGLTPPQVGHEVRFQKLGHFHLVLGVYVDLPARVVSVEVAEYGKYREF